MAGAVNVSLIGFDGGGHLCARVNVGKMEMQILMAKFLQNYDIEPIDKQPVPNPGVGTKSPASPCRIRYKRK